MKIIDKKKVDLKQTDENLRLALEEYILANQDNPDDEIVYTAHTYLDWLTKKTYIVKNEKKFSLTEDQDKAVKRGTVCWIEFGFNIGQEFGGKHPAIIYRRSGQQIFVFPLTTQSPNEHNKKIHVEVPKVYNYAKKDRWVNILNLTRVSIQRIDFSSKFGNVKPFVLDNISKVWKEKGIR